MRQLKSAGMKTKGLKVYYCSNIRPILAYASGAWYNLLSGQNKAELERIQKTAMKTIYPHSNYE